MRQIEKPSRQLQVDITSQYHTLNVLDFKLQQKIKVQKETKNQYHSH